MDTSQESMQIPAPQASSRYALHNQDLVDVMFELDHIVDARAQVAFEMATHGHIHALNENDLKPLREGPGRVFDSSERESPILSGNIPFSTLPNVSQVQKLLTADIGGKPDSFRFDPSFGSPEQDARAVKNLLGNIPNPKYQEPGVVAYMKSPTLDRLRVESYDVGGEGFLHRSNFRVTISPSNEVFDFAYHDCRYHSTLLTGSKVWLVFPPLHGNIATLHEGYKRMYSNPPVEITIDMLKTLRYGIGIIQKPGQTLILPPFWSAMVISKETSTSCQTFVSTAAKFIDRIKHVDTWLMMHRLFKEKEKEQAYLHAHVSELANHFDAILGNKIKHFNAEPLMAKICREWATAGADGSKGMKDKIKNLCASLEDEEEAQRMEQSFQQTWLKLLLEKRKKKLECRICHVRLADLSGPGDLSERLTQHFMEAHW